MRYVTIKSLVIVGHFVWSWTCGRHLEFSLDFVHPRLQPRALVFKLRPAPRTQITKLLDQEAVGSQSRFTRKQLVQFAFGLERC